MHSFKAECQFLDYDLSNDYPIDFYYLMVLSQHSVQILA